MEAVWFHYFEVFGFIERESKLNKWGGWSKDPDIENRRKKRRFVERCFVQIKEQSHLFHEIVIVTALRMQQTKYSFINMLCNCGMCTGIGFVHCSACLIYFIKNKRMSDISGMLFKYADNIKSNKCNWNLCQKWIKRIRKWQKTVKWIMWATNDEKEKCSSHFVSLPLLE